MSCLECLYMQPTITVDFEQKIFIQLLLFLYISKAFDKVWHEGLTFKLKSMGISDALLEVFKTFLWQTFSRELFLIVKHQSVYR